MSKDSNCWQAHNMLASIYIDQYWSSEKKPKDLDFAEQYVDKSLEINKYNGYAHLTKAEILIAKDIENIDLIISHIRDALKNGCPVWYYIENNKNERYTPLLKNRKYKVLENEIKNYRNVSAIAHISLQNESEYIA